MSGKERQSNSQVGLGTRFASDTDLALQKVQAECLDADVSLNDLTVFRRISVNLDMQSRIDVHRTVSNQLSGRVHRGVSISAKQASPSM